VFFMRTSCTGPVANFDTSALPPVTSGRLSNHERKNTVLLDPKEYHCLGKLLRHAFGDLPVNVLRQ